jgi:8-oxo-dGTP diphosphatase
MRPYPDRPVVGVGAVVLDGERVLLIKRGHAPLKGEWSLPGGGVETGETLEQAIAREVLEETGVTIEVGPIVEVLDRISRDADGRVEHHFVLVDFVARPSGGLLRSASDAEDAAWVQLSELSKYGIAPVTLSVIQKASSRGFDVGERPLVW